MGFFDGIKQEVSHLLGTDQPEAPAAPPPPPPPADAAPPPATTATPESSANAAAAHAASLSPAQIQLADKLKNELYAPIPVGKDGRYEYEAALDGLSQDDVFHGPPPEGCQYEDCRCNAETAIGAMLSRGKAGFQESVADLEKYAKQAKPQTADTKALAKECAEIKGNIAKDKVAPYDLAKLADRMYPVFASKDPKTGKPDHAGLDDKQTMKLLNAAGLDPNESQVTAPYNGDPLTMPKAQSQAAANLFKGIGKGDTASVGVAEGTKGFGQMDHWVLVGKKPDGTEFCFDSGLPNPPGPNYFEGKSAIDHVAPMALGSTDNSKFGFPVLRHQHGAAE